MRIRVCVIPLPELEGRICSTVLYLPAIVDNVVTSDVIRMCVFGSALYHCQNWRERFVSLCRMHRPCRVIRPDYVICAQFLFRDVIILFPRQTCVYMLLSNFRHLRSDVTDAHPSRPYCLTAWLHNYYGRRQIDLRRSGYYGTQPRRVRSSKDQRDPVIQHTRDILE